MRESRYCSRCKKWTTHQKDPKTKEWVCQKNKGKKKICGKNWVGKNIMRKIPPKKNKTKYHKTRKKCAICKEVFYANYSGRLYCDVCKKKYQHTKTGKDNERNKNSQVSQENNSS